MKKILCLDDDKDMLELEQLLLTQSGYQILTAKDATEAMVVTEDVLLDLIVLDLDLAGEDGLVMMKFLLRNHPGVPIILYTGQEYDQEAIAKMLQQGAARYLKKQTGDELVAAVRQLCPLD